MLCKLHVASPCLYLPRKSHRLLCAWLCLPHGVTMSLGLSPCTCLVWWCWSSSGLPWHCAVKNHPPLGDFRYFLAGASWNVCFCVHVVARGGPVWIKVTLVLCSKAAGYQLPQGRQHMLVLLPSLLCVVPPLFGRKVSTPSLSLSHPVHQCLDTETLGPC